MPVNGLTLIDHLLFTYFKKDFYKTPLKKLAVDSSLPKSPKMVKNQKRYGSPVNFKYEITDNSEDDDDTEEMEISTHIKQKSPLISSPIRARKTPVGRIKSPIKSPIKSQSKSPNKQTNTTNTIRRTTSPPIKTSPKNTTINKQLRIKSPSPISPRKSSQVQSKVKSPTLTKIQLNTHVSPKGKSPKLPRVKSPKAKSPTEQSKTEISTTFTKKEEEVSLANYDKNKIIEERGGYTIAQLKNLLRELGLKVSGSKAELVARVKAGLAEWKKK